MPALPTITALCYSPNVIGASVLRDVFKLSSSAVTSIEQSREVQQGPCDLEVIFVSASTSAEAHIPSGHTPSREFALRSAYFNRTSTSTHHLAINDSNHFGTYPHLHIISVHVYFQRTSKETNICSEILPPQPDLISYSFPLLVAERTSCGQSPS